MFIKNYGCIWLAPDFESRSIGDISSSLTMVRSPKYIDAYSPQMLSDIYTNFNEISIISSSLTMIANLFNLNQSLSVASHWRISQLCGTWDHQKSLKAPSSSQLYEQMIPSREKKTKKNRSNLWMLKYAKSIYTTTICWWCIHPSRDDLIVINLKSSPVHICLYPLLPIRALLFS